ncbi:MAG: 4a-hydroxytetrahydrobiopterin dehydratase [Actinobacteria bacterium]|nr:4a-hydroxytetrahydrobiopterin dehydratase [Actinomycetota bacterium]
MTKLARQIASDAAPGWRLALQRLHLHVPTGNFATGLDLVDAIGALAEAADHHPDIDLRYGSVHIALSSHDAGGITDRDIALAGQIDALLAERGLTPSHEDVTVVEIAIDALDIDAIRPFWAAVLGWPDDADELVDPATSGPTVWFQQMDQPQPQRNRIHLDVTVAHDEADARVAAALAAGGTLVNGNRAPAFWILADPEGNEACICTWQNRE